MILDYKKCAQLLTKGKLNGVGYRYLQQKYPAVMQYIPFFDTIQNDILEFSNLTRYGCNAVQYYWPYNKEIEDKLLKLGVMKSRDAHHYNNLKEVMYEYDYDPSYLGNMMNSSGYYNKGYYDECSIRLYHFTYNGCCQTFGGVCLIIDRQSNDIHIFGIGEDDGWFFPETYNYHDFGKSGINKYELWQLCGIVNDIYVANLDNQLIIDKLYKEHEKYNEHHN